MYNSGYSTSPPVAGINNPFSSDPSNPRNRFPEISSPTSDGGSQYIAWLNNGINSNPTGYPQQQQQQIPQFQQPGFQQQMPQEMNTGYGQQSGYLNSPSGFQPTSSFGQQLAAHVSGSSYGYLNGQPTGMPPQQQNAYRPAQQQVQSPGYVAQFDPYAPIGQGWDGQNQNKMTQSQSQPPNQFQAQSQQSVGTSVNSTNSSHPREYIRTHKAEIESWDSYAWKQLMNCFDALKNAWDGRKKELNGQISQLQTQMQYGGGYYQPHIQQEGARLQGLVKEADLNFDSVAASTFQIQEVFSGYRQSGDLASKRRVREATNAALQSLPDWPPQLY
ncbi:hypothetical protein BDQ17DRAFT_1279315 [Cyathus striatus]|nr:hypothetical protein BDQ17DRAFT_1279315 [Cyathus striatus]